jgi:myo-inositol 2-dehydrogenase/D-chiro-inositol 1-dehydrogenase
MPAYRAELAAFVAAVNAGTAPTPSGRDGLMAQRLADAATQSKASGQTVRLG